MQLSLFGTDGISVAISHDYSNLSLLRTTGRSLTKAQLLSLPVPREYIQNGVPNLKEIIKTTLKDYLQSIGFNGPVYLQLPLPMVTLDYFTLPSMKAPKINEALKVEQQNLYPHLNELHGVTKIIARTKRTVTFSSVFVQKRVLRAFNNAVSESKLPARALLFEGSATLNALFALHPKLRKHNFVFFDVKQDSTLVLFCEKERLSGFTTLDFGYRALSDNKIVFEHTLHYHPVGELAVVNAAEIAKAKKLTTAVSLGEPSEEMETAIEGLRVEAALLASSATDDEDQEVEISADNRDENLPVKEKVKSLVKKLPRWMIPDQPATPEGFLALNFNHFIKYALLYTDKVRCNALRFTPEFVAFNLPKRFRYLVEDAKDTCPVPLIAIESGEEADVWENLNLYGAFCGNRFNKNFSF